jgi:RNA polymerase sigma-70 factor, ECF subfamily
MPERQLSESFVHALLDSQNALRAYVTALVLDAHEAEDVLQETNVVLCRQADEFPTINNFTAWACRIAFFEVLSSRKRRHRDRLLFDDALLALVAQDLPRFVEDVSLRQRWLDLCMAELPEAQRQLILKRYGPSGAIKMLAAELGRPVGSVQQSLYRIRLTLAECVQRKMEEEP